MDLADIKYRANAAREFSVTIELAQFKLRMPHRFDVAVAERRSRGTANDAASMVLLERALLVQAVVGWSVVRVVDVLPAHADNQELLEFQSGAVELLLDAQPDWYHQLSIALFDRLAQRNLAQDSAEKNS